MLRFWSSKLDFGRKSRRHASFWGFKASVLKEVSQKSFVFELQTSFLKESRTKASLLIFKASFLKEVSRKSIVFELQSVYFLKEVSQKSFVFELQSFIFEGNLAETLRLTNHVNHTSVDNQNHLNLKSNDHQLT